MQSHDNPAGPWPSENSNLVDFGWRNAFAQQLTLEEHETLVPVRVTAVHRSGLEIAAPDVTGNIHPINDKLGGPVTVGDWLLIDPDIRDPIRRLDRTSLFQRRAPGTGYSKQLIAANIDTIFVVSSCNQDFNIARLERYLTLARSADVTPVIVLTKADLAPDPEAYGQEARAQLPGVLVEVVNALSPEAADCLRPWCRRGQTVAFVGSSGVGKSALLNALASGSIAKTQGVREGDDKGRHTTTHRQLHPLDGGGWVLDTPGMRELALLDVSEGIKAVFSDIEELAARCKFSDCQHETEPGCEVQKAVTEGILMPDRLRRWAKLHAEDAYNSQSLAERRAKDKTFGKLIRRIQEDSRK